MVKRFMAVIMVAAAALMMLGCSVEVKNGGGDKKASGQLEVKVLNVGQGDAVLIKSGQQTVLIDTSDIDERSKLRNELKKAGVSQIDKLIITHPHADHLGGAAVVFKEFKVLEVYDNGLSAKPKFYLDYLKEIKKQNILYKTLCAGDVLDFGNGVEYSVLSPAKEFIESGAKNKKGKVDYNGSSIVGRLTFGNFAMMLTGDVEKGGEAMIVKKSGSNLKCQVLKAGHHGSKSSSSEKFLKAVAPESVVISCGAGNDYGHPHEPIIERYKKFGVNIYRTDENGTVTIISDGKTYSIKGER